MNAIGSLVHRLEKDRDVLVGALLEALEYFEDREDADCDQDGFIPNTEMKIAVAIREAIATVGAA